MAVDERRLVSAELNELARVDLFRDLAAPQLSRLNAVLRRQIMPAGRSIIAEEQPGEVVYVILRGTVRIQVVGANGEHVILAILGPGEVVGEMSVVDRQTRSASVITIEPSVLAWADRASFWDCMRSMPALTLNLAQILSRRLRIANAQIESLATLDVYGRVARQILAFADEYGRPGERGGVVIPIRLTQSDLAGLVGASRVRVNQVLVSFKRRKYLSVDSSYRIVVHDRAALAARCQ